MILLRLYYEFFKIGLFSIGGGLATLPFLYDLSDRLGWFTYNDVANMIAIAESTPGAIGINMATYAGYKVDGVIGGIVATLGLASPCIIIILLIAHFLKKFNENKIVQDVFFGLRPASVAMIASAGIGVVKIALLNIPLFQTTHHVLDLFFIPGILIAVGIYIVSKKTKWSPILLIFISAVIGIVFHLGGA